MAGYREFQTGEVLTAANVDDFLAKQAVMKFADAAARNTALGTAVGGSNALREGMVAYLDDTDELLKYDGTSWATVGNAGIGSNLVSTKVTADFSTSSSPFVPVTGATVTITLTSASSRVLVLFSARRQANNATNGYVVSRIERSGTTLAQTEQRVATADHGMHGPVMTATETPGSVGPHTYTVEASNAGVTGTVTLTQPMYLTVIEVAA